MANESITLTTPTTPPAITGYSFGSLHLDAVPTPRIVATIIRSDGRGQVYTYPAAGTPTDTPAKTLALIEALNTANLPVRSLWRRLFDKLVADFPQDFPGGATVP